MGRKEIEMPSDVLRQEQGGLLVRNLPQMNSDENR